MVPREFGHERLDAYAKGIELHLPEIAVLHKAASQVSQIFRPYAKLVIVLPGRIGVNIDLLTIVTANLFFHVIHAWLVDFIG